MTTATTTAPHQHIVEALAELHDARQNAALFGGAVRAARSEWEAGHAEMLASHQAHAEALTRAEELVRSLALAHYQVTGEARPTPGVEIVLRTQVEITDEAATRDWATRSGTGLVLDRRAIEKAAAAIPIPGVVVSQVPSTRIASDLGRVMADAAGGVQ